MKELKYLYFIESTVHMANNLIRTAMVLAAGLGSRLGEQGKKTPKALTVVNGVPMLESILLRFRQTGIENVIINIHHLGEQIESFMKVNDNFGLNVSFSKEERLLGTGGSIKFAYPLLKDKGDFILHNCDVFSNFKIENFINQHYERLTSVSLLTKQRETKRYLVFDEQKKLIGWEVSGENAKSEYIKEESLSEDWHRYGFCGVHLIATEFLNFILQTEEDNFSIIETYMNAVRKSFNISCHDIGDAYWADVGTPESIARVNKEMKVNFSK